MSYKKLLKVQSELKAPKNQYNSFGKYNYRSCEDILEAVKPLLLEHRAVIVISDKVINIGDRYYVEATARFVCVDEGTFIESTASARESLDKKGMDDSQITGTASSYARKYALNGLLCIDDTKDADVTNTHDKTNKPAQNTQATQKKEVTPQQKEVGKLIVEKYGQENAVSKLIEMTAFEINGKKVAGKSELCQLTDKQVDMLLKRLKGGVNNEGNLF